MIDTATFKIIYFPSETPCIEDGKIINHRVPFLTKCPDTGLYKDNHSRTPIFCWKMYQ